MQSAPVLSGHGFVLRALGVSDAGAWKAGEDPEQIRWFEAPGPAPMANVVAAIDRWRAGWSDGGDVHHWGIWVDDELAGGVEIRVREDGRGSLSYVVFPRFRMKGLASGAARLAAEWALSHLDVTAVVAVIDEENTASRRVAERAGFRADGLADPSEYSESGVMLRYVLDADD